MEMAELLNATGRECPMGEPTPVPASTNSITRSSQGGEIMEGRWRSSARGFVRHDLQIVLAIIGISLAVGIPQYLKHGIVGALGSVLLTAGIIVGGVALLILVVWLFLNAGREGTGWRDLIFRGAGHLVRFLAFAFFGFLFGMPAIFLFGSRLGARLKDLVALTLIVLAGLVGSFLYHRLGGERLWPAIGKFCLALVCSLFGGMAGMSSPDDWVSEVAALVPIAIFFVLAAMGKIVPPRQPKEEQAEAEDHKSPRSAGPC